MLCLRRLTTSLTCPRMMSSHIWLLIILFLVAFDGLYMMEFIEPLFYPSEASRLSFPSFDPSFRKLGPYFPKQGLFFWTYFLR